MPQNEFLCFQVITMTDQNFFKELGQRISKARKQANLTQVQLADMLGVKQQVVASYEVGRRRVPASSLPQLALVLGVSVEDLLGHCGRSAKPGPAPKLQQQIEQLQRLPKGKQKFVSEFLDTVLQQAHA
jgi:transcriptional regulator with XRE-family HTH domain